MPEVVVCSDGRSLARRAVATIVAEIERAIGARGRAQLALSGGTTPVRTYQLLAASPVRWDEVELWFADERCVGPQDPESNYRLVVETLARPAGVAEDRVHRMEGELGPAEGARRYAELLRSRLDTGERGLPVLDLVVLGIGPEGHIASLFPNSQVLPPAEPGEQEGSREAEGSQGDEGSGPIVSLAIHDSPKPPPERISLSLEVLRAARRCLLLASGEAKADALGRALGPPSPAAPASLLAGDRLTVLADTPAAARLPAREGSRPDLEASAGPRTAGRR